MSKSKILSNQMCIRDRYAGMPEFPAADPITAAAVGVVSGLAATGINQAVKQLGKTE